MLLAKFRTAQIGEHGAHNVDQADNVVRHDGVKGLKFRSEENNERRQRVSMRPKAVGTGTPKCSPSWH